MKKIINIFFMTSFFCFCILSFLGNSFSEEDETEYRDMFVADQPSASYIGVKYINGFWDVDGFENIAERPDWGSYRVWGEAGLYKNLFALYGSFEIGEYQRDSISGTDNVRVNNKTSTTGEDIGIRKTSYSTTSDDLREEYHVGIKFNLYKLLGRLGMSLEPYRLEEKKFYMKFVQELSTEMIIDLTAILNFISF